LPGTNTWHPEAEQPWTSRGYDERQLGVLADAREYERNERETDEQKEAFVRWFRFA
jgi:hypothetical protein